MSRRKGRGVELSLVAVELDEVAVNTEDEFLAIGERLMDFQQRATAISAVVNAMVDQLRAGRGATARDDLASILNILQRSVTSSRQQGGAQHSLRLLKERLEQVTTPFMGFSQLNLQLKLLGTYTKIECSHLGDKARDFVALADHVVSQSDEVSRKAEAILGRRDTVAATIQEALATASSMEDASRESIGGILEKTQRNLYTLTTMATHCATAAGVIAATSSEVAANLGDVVVSLQTHDMVRQQVRHVAEALDELAGRWRTHAAGPGAWLRPDRALLVESGQLCVIQTAQLNHSATALSAAVEQIIAALRAVAAREMLLAEETIDLLGTGGLAGTSIFTEMGRDLHEAIDALLAGTEANRQLATSMVAVATTVEEIVHFAADINTIAYDIKLIALNAQVQTANMGSEGNSLGVLAGAIQQLSVAARDHAEGASQVLCDIKSITADMHETARNAAANVEVKFEEMRGILEEVLAALQAMNEDTTSGLTTANRLVLELGADIEEACGAITVHHRLAGVLDKGVAVLDGISQGVMALVPSAEWPTASLASPASRYTMHSERDIHAGIAGGREGVAAMGVGVAALPPPVESESDDQGLGDNVELF
jgi:hypothetical protein